jgi:hypothetical protein
MTYAAKAESLVQNFAARWRSIRKIFFNPNQATRRNNARYNSKMKLQHTLKIGKKKRTQPIKQNNCYSHFYFKTKQTRPSGAVRGEKEQRKP